MRATASRACRSCDGERLVGILTNRDVRFERNLEPQGLRGDDEARTSSRRALGHHPGRSQRRSFTATASRSFSSSMRRGGFSGLITVKDIQKAIEYPTRARTRTADCCAARQSAWAAIARARGRAGGGGRRRGRASIPRTAISKNVIDTVTEIKVAHPAPAGHRRQRRNRRRCASADRRRRRRRQGRHGRRLDLHDAHHFRRRHAAAHRRHRSVQGRPTRPASR